MEKIPLQVNNSFCYFPATAPTYMIREIDKATSYLWDGAAYVPAFKNGFWDGKTRLLTHEKGNKRYKFPAGVLADVLKLTCGQDFEIIDNRRQPGERKELQWVGKELFEYQARAVEAAQKDRGVATGKGLLHLPIRAGKTMIAAKLIQEMGLKTLFIVTSDMLLYQTYDVFTTSILGSEIGMCGDGRWLPRWITVATIQTLLARYDEFIELIKDIDLLIFDEAHHFEGEAWRNPILASEALYKIGLSATLFLNKEEPNEASSIWIRACSGPKLFTISMNELMKLGRLVPPTVFIYPINKRDRGTPMKGPTVYKYGITSNSYRNAAIADLAEQGVNRGMRVLIDTGRKDQLTQIFDYLKARNIPCAKMWGETKTNVRLETLRKFKAGKILAIVGTILGEGIDIPELEMVINAEGQQSQKATIQRMRNLTTNPDMPNKRAIICDFADLIHTKLAQHSEERLRIYRGIRGVKVEAGIIEGDTFVLPET